MTFIFYMESENYLHTNTLEMQKQKIIKTGSNTFKTTEQTRISEDSGNYKLTGVYMKSGKERSGEVFIPSGAIDHIETLDSPENE